VLQNVIKTTNSTIGYLHHSVIIVQLAHSRSGRRKLGHNSHARLELGALENAGDHPVREHVAVVGGRNDVGSKHELGLARPPGEKQLVTQNATIDLKETCVQINNKDN
jgi:hypothetical protein